MRVLFNCATNVVGGGVKNAAWFIKLALNDNEIFWYFVVSPQVYDVLKDWNVLNGAELFVFEISPSKSYSARRRLLQLCSDLEIDVVYTMAGPTYVDFKCYHVMGLSDPYITHAGLEAIMYNRSFISVLRLVFAIMYKIYYARMADFWLFQTDYSRNKFISKLYINRSRTKIISNAVGTDFLLTNSDTKSNGKGRARVLCPAASYPHKALVTIPRVAKSFNILYPDVDFVFIVTLPGNSREWKSIEELSRKLDVSQFINNIGVFSPGQAVEIHRNADIVYVPSILETFSGSYLEAISLKMPLIVADRGFAREICEDYAVFVDPFDYEGCALSIKSILDSDFNLNESQVSARNRILHTYDSQLKRFHDIKKLLLNEIKYER